MKAISLSVAMAVAVSSSAAWGADMSAFSKPTLTSTSSRFSASGFSDKEIAAWVTSWEDTRSHRKYEFRSAFRPMRVEERDKRKYQKSGEIPFRITAELTELKESKGRILRKRATGTARIAILDIEGKKVISKSMSLAKLCPS
jgi:hypothetical protein